MFLNIGAPIVRSSSKRHDFLDKPSPSPMTDEEAIAAVILIGRQEMAKVDIEPEELER